MKNLQVLCVSLAVMLCLVNCESDMGWSNINTTSNEDPNSCTLNLTYAIEADKVVFTATQNFPDPANPSCTHQDILTAPVFYNLPFTPKSIVLTPTADNANILTGAFTFEDAKAALGHSCLHIGHYGALDEELWTCKFKYSGIYFHMNLHLALPTNTSFDTNWTYVLIPEITGIVKNQVIVYDNSFPHIVGKIGNPCGSDNNKITNLDTTFAILGTEYLSNTFDLNKYLSGYTLHAIVLRSNDTPAEFYRLDDLQDNLIQPFMNAGAANGCQDTGLLYRSFVPDLGYCANGCAVSLVFYGPNGEYILMTNGITTGQPGNLRA